jgi:hypothetical protein
MANTSKKSRQRGIRFTGIDYALGVEFGVIFALAGTVLGAMAGPPGLVGGAIVGGVLGMFTALAYGSQAERHAAHDARLDADLGISEGDIGAPNLPHDPARIGAFSAAAMGAGSYRDQEPAEGPFTLPF